MILKGIIFDVDGTLLDSMGIWETIGEDYLRSLGIKPYDHVNQIVHDMSLTQSATYFQQVYHVSKSIEEIIQGINDIIKDFYFYQAQLKPGALDILKLLKQRHIRMCIATATDEKLVHQALVRCGIRDYFIDILTCEKVGYGKDSPEIYQEALKILDIKQSEAWVIEDAYYAMKTLKQAGFIGVGIYDQYEKNQQGLIELSDIYIQNYHELEDYL